MKTTTLSLISAVIILAACHTAKKSTASTITSAITPSPTSTITANESRPAYNFSEQKYTHGVYPPGDEELIAIQAKHKDVSLEVLQQGYTIYAVGKCINCHGAKNIYKHSEMEWKDIIDDMALRAKISDAEKDAVYKYVLAIKAAKPQ